MALALAACAGRNTAAPGIVPDEPTTLSVENNNFSDMRIYVHQGGQRIRLGTANGSKLSEFKIPKSVVFGVTSLRFEAVPIGGRGSSISETITIHPGETIMMRIPPL
jgi:hypothetical protein